MPRKKFTPKDRLCTRLFIFLLSNSSQGVYLIFNTFVTKKNRAEFLFLNKSGERVKHVFLPEQEGVAYTFYKNMYYYMAEDDQETWELRCEEF